MYKIGFTIFFLLKILFALAGADFVVLRRVDRFLVGSEDDFTLFGLEADASSAESEVEGFFFGSDVALFFVDLGIINPHIQ
jgi:hypothetical protein